MTTRDVQRASARGANAHAFYDASQASNRQRTAYSYKDASIEFGPSVSKLYELTKAGTLRVKHMGRKSLLCGDSLRRWWNSLPDNNPSKHLPPLAKTGAVRPTRRRRATSGAARSA